MEKKTKIILGLIVFVGFLLRFVGLSYNPPSLNWDEISHGYNAYSILKTGMDQWGQRFPVLNFRAYGDYPTTLNLYLTAPFILMLGLSEFSIRLPHVIAGTLTILSVYYLVFGLTKKQNMGLLSAFLVAIGPWYFFTSRFVLQSNISVFLVVASAAFFVNRSKNKNYLFYSLILFTFTLFSYHTTRIFSPLLLVVSLFVYRKYIKSKKIYLYAAFFLGLSIYVLFSPVARARGNVLFVIDQGAVNKIESERANSKYPKTISRLIYNRPVYFVEEFSKKYFSYFTPRFLFLEGGTQYQFSLPGFGLISPIWMPFFYLGIFVLIQNCLKKESDYLFILAWLLLSPIPASLTNESYTVLRATTMLPIPELLIALGIYKLIDFKQKINVNWFLPIMIFMSLLFLERYLVVYFNNYRTDYSWSWQYGYKEIVNYVSDHYREYDNIIITKKYGEPHEFFLFYLKYDPLKYLDDPDKITFKQANWYWVDRFDKYYFVNDWEIKLNDPLISSIQNHFVTESKHTIDCTNKTCLLITSPNNFPPGWVKQKTIYFLDGKPAFEIYSNRI